MFRPNRFFSTMCLLIITAFLFTACGTAATPTAAPATVAPTAAPTQASPIKIGFFLPDTSTARYDTKDKPLFEADLSAICPTCQVIYDNSPHDPSEQLSAVEAALTNGVKVVTIMAVDTKAAATIADKAKAAGVPVVSYSRLLQNSDGVTVNLAFNLTDYGKAQAQSLIDALNKKGIANPKIVQILGAANDSNVPVMEAGHMDVFKPLVDAGKLTIIKTENTPNWDPATAQNEMQQIITETGGQIDGVLTENDGMAGGIIQAFKTAGISPIPPVVGGDCDLAAIQRIVAGEQWSSGYLPIPMIAEYAAKVSYGLATTGQVPAGMVTGTTNNGSIDVPTVFIPVGVVDITNVKSTIIADNVWTVDQICTPEFDAACKAAGLK